jgi:hypothetical protein
MSYEDMRFTLLLPEGSEVKAPEKACTKCGATKPTTEFNKHRKSKDGLQTWCRVCTTEAARAYNKRQKAKANRSAGQKKRWKKEKTMEKKQAGVSGEAFLKSLDTPDPVNSPEHYRTGGIECIDAMVRVFGDEAVRTYARINAFKYIWRHNYKGKPEEDLAKAAWYTRFANGDDPRKEGKQ